MRFEYRSEYALKTILAKKDGRFPEPSAHDRKERQDHERRQHHPRTLMRSSMAVVPSRSVVRAGAVSTMGMCLVFGGLVAGVQVRRYTGRMGQCRLIERCVDSVRGAAQL